MRIQPKLPVKRNICLIESPKWLVSMICLASCVVLCNYKGKQAEYSVLHIMHSLSCLHRIGCKSLWCVDRVFVLKCKQTCIRMYIQSSIIFIYIMLGYTNSTRISTRLNCNVTSWWYINVNEFVYVISHPPYISSTYTVRCVLCPLRFDDKR